ncbi:MAG TPA: hypothetical protein PLZ51_06580 [Aggregatilineales bacterium]|nr:hypothetical protein [Aggregatilineales bacterium]
MTTNHHTAIAVGAPANASTFNAPLGQLDSAIDTLDTAVDGALADVATLDTTVSNLISGAGGFTQLNLSTTTTLTIASGAITVTRSRHLVDTESSGAYDDLETINGSVAGDVLVLQSVNSARVVVVRHGVGYIFLNGEDVHLDNPRKTLTVIYDGTLWVLVGDPPKRIDRKQMRVNFTEAGAVVIGHSALSNNGTLTNSLEADGPYTQYASAASFQSNAGPQSVTSTLFQPRHNPSMTAWLRTSSSIAVLRWYVGIHTGGIYGAADNLASTGVSGVVFRYSTVAGDTGWRPVTSNGTTQTVHAQLGGNIAVSTAYKLSMWIVNNVAYFVVNDSAYFSTALTMPSSTASLGWSIHLQTQEAVAKNALYKHLLLEMN